MNNSKNSNWKVISFFFRENKIFCILFLIIFTIFSISFSTMLAFVPPTQKGIENTALKYEPTSNIGVVPKIVDDLE